MRYVGKLLLLFEGFGVLKMRRSGPKILVQQFICKYKLCSIDFITILLSTIKLTIEIDHLFFI